MIGNRVDDLVRELPVVDDRIAQFEFGARGGSRPERTEQGSCLLTV